jgi:hypothetical protein
MIAFEVSLNGKRACVAGVEGFGVLSAILSWVRRHPEKRRQGRTAAEGLIVVGGLRSEASGPGEHLKWISRSLRVGDRVSIRVVDTLKVDVPATRHRDDPVTIERAKRQYLQRLKKELKDRSVATQSNKGAAPDRGRPGVRAKRAAPRRGRSG